MSMLSSKAKNNSKNAKIKRVFRKFNEEMNNMDKRLTAYKLQNMIQNNSQKDNHCWKYFKIKYGVDYTQLNRERIYQSRINK